MLNYKSKFILLCNSFMGFGLAMSAQADTITLFEGKNLDGWKGDPKFWSVEDGFITGQCSEENPCKQTTYLTYTKKEFQNFELTLKFRFLSEKGNSGIQYRSQWADEKLFKIKGYQADIETGINYSGILYEQDGRGIVARRGEKVTIDLAGKKTVDPKPIADAKKAQDSIKAGEWSTYRVVADGKHLTHLINGFTTVQVEDNEKNRSSAKGMLALQLHKGPPMKVQYKDIKILELLDTKDKPVIKKKTSVNDIKSLDGFHVEQIYSVDKKSEGSWVSMCFDDKGALFVCDQYGSLYKLIIEDGKVAKKTAIESAGHAQGLCWAYGSLYIVSSNRQKPGVYCLTDTTGDGQFDKQELILNIKGFGEHGTHGLIKDPKGEGFYFIVGNFTKPPQDAGFTGGRNWAEDTLHPHLNDASGHAVGKKAPAGTLLWLSKDGKKRKIISIGMRNTYDIAASPTGELFGYDSDMEYDVGTPWYRPTRVYHYIDGADYGWRTGTGKWPDYYADSLGSVLDIGPGCPTGVVFGTGAKFPAEYQKALYILDWTFGRIYALHLSPDGVTYSAKKEVFVSGKPLPLTDAVVGPDGAMYFLTGGRRLQSALYRVSYKGAASTAPVAAEVVSAAQKQLRQVQASRDVAELWKSLGSVDRTLRYAARVSLEQIPTERWLSVYESATDAQTIITASLALSRKKADTGVIFGKLLEIDFNGLNEGLKIEYLRAVSLACIRGGRPGKAVIDQLLTKFNLYPSASAILNRELCRVLVYLDSSSVLSKTLLMMSHSVVVKEDIPMELLAGHDKYGKDIMNMLKNQPDSQALHYALMLKNQKSGWNEATVRSYYQWLAKAESKTGGNSYKGFIRNIRKEAMKNLNADAKLVGIAKESSKLKVVTKPMAVAKGPGRNWTHEEAVKAIKDLSKADAANGKKMYQAILCMKCHAHSGEGGGSGPELTQLANRFSKEDILKAIIVPSEVVSDQYKATVLHLNDQSTLEGKIMKEDAENVYLATNPFDLSMQTAVLKSKIAKRVLSHTSSMPPSLINALNPDELRDLMLFLTNK